MRPLRTRAVRALALTAAAMLIATGCSTGTRANSTSAAAGQIPPTASAGELRNHALQSIEGKTVAFVPVGLGTPLMEEWNRQMESGFKAAGLNYVLRDPNWDTAKQAEAVQSLINEKPAVLVVHNF
ncbi:sugar ABC transporter substrate-binding protein, partial [Amycolatopsis tucumanensis]|nr:sugar ABC transporter substrate-binding protein [Amycolatopsis tucumanensis]